MIQFADAALAATPPNPTDNDRLADEIAELAAHLHAATYRLLMLLREYDAREAWGWGFRSCAHWLSWRTGIAPGAAREKVRVARALGSLPRISAAMERGGLSYSKARALTRVATADNESSLLEFAQAATASQVEGLVRGVAARTGRRRPRRSGSGTSGGTCRCTGRGRELDTAGSSGSGGGCAARQGARVGERAAARDASALGDVGRRACAPVAPGAP